MLTTMLSSLIISITLSPVAQALYLPPNPWTTTATSAPTESTLAAMLLPRQDNGGDVKVIYENGRFVDDRFAELFNCVAGVAESNPNFGLLPPVNQPDPPAPPPPSPSPTSTITPNPQGEPGDGLPIAPPQPPSPNTGSDDPAPGPNCNTVDRINGAEPPKGNPPASFLVDDMQELFTNMCDGAKRYPLDEDADKTYKNGRDDTTGPPYEAKVRLVATARGLEGNNVGIYDKGRCKENFQAIMDECNDRGGEYAVDYTNYKLYAFRTNPE